MTLRIAVQMDPLESIKIAGDSSFALMLSAQARGHELFHYDVRTLAYDASSGAAGRLTCWGAPITVQRVEGAHFTRGEYRLIDLVADIDVVLMRQDPPFDLGYITATHLLERLAGQTLVVNDPLSVRNAPEKVFVLDYARFMPPTFIARRIEDVRLFQQRNVEAGFGGDLVIKPLHGNGGKAVFRVPADGSNLGALIEMFENAWVEPFMVQPFLPDVAEGDKRIVLVDAEAAGLTSAEEEICAALGSELKARGLVFVGIDVIGGKWLTEINVTSPTGIVAIDRFNGTDTGAKIWDAIEARHAAM
jgi:glutathione synthase